MNPIRFEADYAEPRNRLTVFFRLIVAIPWYIWLSLYGVVAFLAAIVAWFAMLFTKRYPQGLYDFVAGYVKLSAQVGGWVLLVTDEWPPFMPDRDDYPVRVEVAPQQVEYRRAQTFFKYLLSFPQQLILFGLVIPVLAGRRSSPGGGSCSPASSRRPCTTHCGCRSPTRPGPEHSCCC